PGPGEAGRTRPVGDDERIVRPSRHSPQLGWRRGCSGLARQHLRDGRERRHHFAGAPEPAGRNITGADWWFRPPCPGGRGGPAAAGIGPAPGQAPANDREVSARSARTSSQGRSVSLLSLDRGVLSHQLREVRLPPPHRGNLELVLITMDADRAALVLLEL